MSENDRPLYVDSKKYYILCISLYVFSETNGTVAVSNFYSMCQCVMGVRKIESKHI